jgi:GT2 family glycosyltransferase
VHAAGAGDPPVTVAVVSWNTRVPLLRCLRSLLPEVEAGRARVWVIDNGSHDGSPEAARQQAPWAEVLEPGGNLGFGSAVNLVARQTDTPWLACANADVALAPGALSAMLGATRDRSVGCVAPRLVLPDGSTQHSVYPFPTVPFTLAFNLGMHRLSRRLADRLCLEGFWNPEQPRTVPWAIGAFLLMRREAFDSVGGFDQERWLYAEDLDLGWRLHDAGWGTWYEPQAHVLHCSGAATEIAFGDQRVARFMTATYAVLVRRRGRVRARTTAVLNVLGAVARLVWMAPLAAVTSRWQEPLRSNWMWLSVHWRGLRVSAVGGEERTSVVRASARP